MNIFYGYDSEHYIDITDIVIKKCLTEGALYYILKDDSSIYQI